jgi:hypothetical protein
VPEPAAPPTSLWYSNGEFVAIFFIKDANLAATAASYGVSAMASGSMGLAANVIELRGVDQTTTYDVGTLHTVYQNCDNPAQPSTTFTTNADQEFVVDVAGFSGDGGTGTPGSGQTKTLELSGGSAHGIASYKLPVATGSTTMSWSGKNCNNHVHAVAAFRRGTR